MVCIPSETPLEKGKFSFASSYQPGVASGLGCGPVSTLLSTEGFPSGPDLCRPCMCCHNFCEFTCGSVLLNLEGHVSLMSSIPSGSNDLSASPAGFPDP